jgi:hypothetical protein
MDAWMMLIFHKSISATHQYPSNICLKRYICTMLWYRGMNYAQVEYSSDKRRAPKAKWCRAKSDATKSAAESISSPLPVV